LTGLLLSMKKKHGQRINIGTPEFILKVSFHRVFLKYYEIICPLQKMLKHS
jgi:hypothetical protein